MIRYYQDLREKKKIISDVLSQGLIIEHSDYIDINGNATDGKSGRLTFRNIPPPQTSQPKELTAGEFIDLLMAREGIFQKPSTITRFRTLLRLN